MTQVNQLLGNKWIERCEGPWGSMIVLAQKPHQEKVMSIKGLIWRMCVSYRRLNSVTKPFQFPIPRCDDAVSVMSWRAGELWIIGLDVRQGYHQVAVRNIDREKIDFFAPDNRKYYFNVMLFDPTNAPPFYTAMMKDFKYKWDRLFIIRVFALKLHESKVASQTAAQEIQIDGNLAYESKMVIDDILIWCANKTLILLYFRCVCDVFLKYRVSF